VAKAQGHYVDRSKRFRRIFSQEEEGGLGSDFPWSNIAFSHLDAA
jgi:hypothetical protein